MDPPPAPAVEETSDSQTSGPSRNQSFSQQSDSSQTAAEFIDSQLQLEADAREALPYRFDECTKPLGKLRQVLFSCLTCNPPPTNPSDPYTPAGVCYSCSIQCHGEHILVELFNKRDFICDCGTKRLPVFSPCTLRLNAETNTKGGVHSEEPEPNNKYNQNFKNQFCGCEFDYEAEKQKGTMFQCMGLGTSETGGCGEDWWHPGCVVGFGPDWIETMEKGTTKQKAEGFLGSVAEVAEIAVAEPVQSVNQKEDTTKDKSEGLLESVTQVADEVVGEPSGNTKQAEGNETVPAEVVDEEPEDDDTPLPPGFPQEDDFDGFLCYKCVDAHPWIKRYAGAPGFLAPVFKRSAAPSPEVGILTKVAEAISLPILNDKKRKASDDENIEDSIAPAKRQKEDSTEGANEITDATSQEVKPTDETSCKYAILPPAPEGQISLFFKSDFRDHLCRCSSCFSNLKPHNQLLEEEDTYEPPLSEGGEETGGSTVGSGSIYDRGESALKNVDRVRAIEGVMAYNHLKDKLKPFFQQFAESGKAISADDIKAHFAKMRGDEQAIKEAGEAAKAVDKREEQPGY